VDHHPESQRVVIASPCTGVGFKFAPAIGEGVALLLLEGAAPADLAPFGMRAFAT
jgi:sarcosine oxidase